MYFDNEVRRVQNLKDGCSLLDVRDVLLAREVNFFLQNFICKF